MSTDKLQELQRIARASQVTTTKPLASAPPATGPVPLSEAAAELPEHIVKAVSDNRKLNTQAPFFKCPAWADLPTQAYHLSCEREGMPLASLALHRYPYYLLGKNAQVCDYTMDHPSISGIHAALVFHGGQKCFVLVDLNSTNGCRVNDQRVERQRPVPVPPGTQLRFGFSTRRYEVRLGAPVKRDRAQLEASSTDTAAQAPPEKKPAVEGTDNATSTRQAVPPVVAEKPLPEKGVDGGDSDSDLDSVFALVEDTAPGGAPETTETANREDVGATEAELRNTTEPVPGPPPPAAPPSPPPPSAAAVDAPAAIPDAPTRMHLFQLVIKHKDVANPVSKGRNRGEAITRSRADALAIAQFILHTHDDKARAAGVAPRSAAVTSAGGSTTREYFPWTLEEFTEAVTEFCEVSKPKKKGDLGMVERGTFTEAFDAAAFGLARCEASHPVETPLGIHIIYRCD